MFLNNYNDFVSLPLNFTASVNSSSNFGSDLISIIICLFILFVIFSYFFYSAVIRTSKNTTLINSKLDSLLELLKQENK